jgi:hypothetical protein
MQKCFDEDWNRSKIKKFIKSKKERKVVQELLRPIYKIIKDFYKHHASFSGLNVFGLGPNAVIELFNQMGATDIKYLNTAAIGIEMTKCNTQSLEDKGQLNTNKGKQ